jgi:cytochrome c1
MWTTEITKICSTVGPWLTVSLALLSVSCGLDNVALGKRIYQSGEGTKGYLSYQQGPDWLALAKRGCQACHGPAGQGRVVRAGTVTGTAPPLTPDAMVERGYDEITLRRAITEGLDVSGRPMSYYMPRWQLSERELQALLQYLETF